MGMFFPSSKTQEDLMIKTYTEAKLDPLRVNYIEAHGTGTEVGDPQEAKAIFNAYCAHPSRTDPLPIGLLKSNVGHSEGASGLSSVVKVLLAFENHCIPANLHMTKIKPTIAELCPPLRPVSENMDYTPGIAAVNNFGVGGVNGHVLLEPNYKTMDDNCSEIVAKIPRIVNICCRSEEALNEMFDFLQNNPDKVTNHFLALLTGTMKTEHLVNSTGFPIRGSMIIKKQVDKDDQVTYTYKKHFTNYVSKQRPPLWLLFPGLGGQWSGMAKGLMAIDVFSKKIAECHEILSEFGVDLNHLLLSDDNNTMDSMTHKFCATTALQIGFIDVLRELDITPDGIIGHSFGEIACAYADGCLSAREALSVTYIRGQVTETDPNIPKGLMAVVGMSWEETSKQCPKGVYVVCNNADNTVVVSGLLDETKSFLESLTKQNIFVRELESHSIPYHSPYLNCCADKMTEELKKVLTSPKLRSDKWVSTSILDQSSVDETYKYASAEYFVNNLISSVFFYKKLQSLPKDAVVVEVGPHNLFGKVVHKTLPDSTYLYLLRGDQSEQSVDHLLDTIGQLYELGFNPSIENLYPPVEWPVARSTQSISSLVRWQHKEQYFVRKYPDYYFKYTASDMNETIDMSKLFDSYLPDHCIDNNVIFPASGYLMLAWRQLASSRSKLWNQLPVTFEEVQFKRPVFLSEFEKTKLKVRYHDASGL